MAKNKRKIPRITSKDSQIFADLRKARRPLPVGKLAKRIDASWKTVDKHVKKLEELGVVNTKKSIRRTNVSLNPKFIALLKKKKKLR